MLSCKESSEQPPIYALNDAIKSGEKNTLALRAIYAATWARALTGRHVVNHRDIAEAGTRAQPNALCLASVFRKLHLIRKRKTARIARTILTCLPVSDAGAISLCRW